MPRFTLGPSHVAATVLVYLHAGQFGPGQAVAGAVYAVLMALGVLYLGEHYVVDAAHGWVNAVSGWWIAQRLIAGAEATHTPVDVVVE